ncbi:MAG: response regulator transcription factor [Ginsengibacter sp.]
MTCFVIDDEPLAIDLLNDHINRVSFLQLSETFPNPLQALLSLNNNPVDLIFLDIQMPQLNGVQFMQLLQNRAMVIITSAYQEYAMDGFEHNVVDYLLKPISFERFYRGVEKAYNIKNPHSTINAPEEMFPTNAGYIFIKVENKMVRVELDDILYIEGLKNYVSIFTKTQRIITLQVMKQLEEILPSNRFVRVHKSFIIAIDKIISIERQEIYLKDKIIPIGNTYSENFYKVVAGLKP